MLQDSPDAFDRDDDRPSSNVSLGGSKASHLLRRHLPALGAVSTVLLRGAWFSGPLGRSALCFLPLPPYDLAIGHH